MLEALKNHWREYLIEAWCLAAFMVSACAFGVALFHPESPAAALDRAARGVLMGLSMGATAVAIILSPWGRRSGAHFNPAVTLTYWRLGKIGGPDAFFYIAAHFAGGAAGVFASWMLWGSALAHADVNFVVTVPGRWGAGWAFAAEAVISFLLMTTVLISSNSPRVARLTPFFAGALVAAFISLEAPVSGMSMNPARSFASAAVAGHWPHLWIYFLAPPAAMLAAAEAYVRAKGLSAVYCAKLNHSGAARCIFNCRFGELSAAASQRNI